VVLKFSLKNLWLFWFVHKVLMIRVIQCEINNSIWMRNSTKNCILINQKLTHFTMHKTYDYFKSNLMLNEKSLHKILTTFIYEKDNWWVNYQDIMWLNWLCINSNQWSIDIRFKQNNQSRSYGNQVFTWVFGKQQD